MWPPWHLMLEDMPPCHYSLLHWLSRTWGTISFGFSMHGSNKFHVSTSSHGFVFVPFFFVAGDAKTNSWHGDTWWMYFAFVYHLYYRVDKLICYMNMIFHWHHIIVQITRLSRFLCYLWRYLSLPCFWCLLPSALYVEARSRRKILTSVILTVRHSVSPLVGMRIWPPSVTRASSPILGL